MRFMFVKRSFGNLVLVALLGLIPASAFADAGDDWVAAFQAGKVKKAVKASSTAGLRYGNTGKTTELSDKAIGKAYRSFFRKLRKSFKGAEVEKGTCTSVGRELGYMSQEWKSKSEAVAEWIRTIPESFCDGIAPVEPKLTLLKVLGDDLPHAIVIFQTGEEQLVTGVFHF
jgi:hypothetical protein